MQGDRRNMLKKTYPWEINSKAFVFSEMNAVGTGKLSNQIPKYVSNVEDAKKEKDKVEDQKDSRYAMPVF